MSKGPQLLIHAGYRKTATTWLQNEVFANLPGINYLGKTERDYPRWLIDWHYLDDYAFDREADRIREQVSALCRPGLPNVLSSEGFAISGVTIKQADRIKRLFPDAAILLVLRDPIEVIKSLYRGVVGDGLFFLPLEACLDWTRTPFDLHKRRGIFLPDFFYDETVDYHRRLFGADRVTVMRYERLLDDPAAFFDGLEGFLGIAVPAEVRSRKLVRVNEGVPEPELALRRMQNFAGFLEQQLPAVAQRMSASLRPEDFAGELCPPELRARLIEYFAGRCGGYY